MLTQIRNLQFYIQVKLGQRGAEMVEYALVLACVCAVGAAFYGVGVRNYDGTGGTLDSALNVLWATVGRSVTALLGDD